jgi:hypothetical protein
MSGLSQWCENVEAKVAFLAEASRTGILPFDAKAPNALAARGFFGVLALWKETSVTVGLQALPGVEPASWPGVIEKDGQALTLSADARTLLPRFLLIRFLSNNASGLEELAAEWSGVRERFEGLHEVLGGYEGPLDAVGRVIDSPVHRKSMVRNRKQPMPFESAMSAIARQVEPTPEFECFADWLDAAIAGDPKPRYAPEQLGVWARQCFCWAQKLLTTRPERVKLPGAAVLQIIEAFAGTDPSVS